jgi:cytoskeletal protein CcmA (bactofilin family)
MIPAVKDSVIGEGVTLRGGVTTKGGLQLSGEVYGEVRADRIAMAESSLLEGSAEAEIVEVRGRLTGTITGRDVRLYATARVEADITYEQLTIEMGARFQGSCTPADAAKPQGQAQQAKRA